MRNLVTASSSFLRRQESSFFSMPVSQITDLLFGNCNRPYRTHGSPSANRCGTSASEEALPLQTFLAGRAARPPSLSSYRRSTGPGCDGSTEMRLRAAGRPLLPLRHVACAASSSGLLQPRPCQSAKQGRRRPPPQPRDHLQRLQQAEGRPRYLRVPC